MDGLPASAEITFQPERESEETGRASTAYTDEDGYFRLGYNSNHYGAVPGKHDVTIRVFHRWKDGEKLTIEGETPPLRIARLKRTVSSDGSEFHFPLSY